MSAIAKPLISSSTCDTPEVRIPSEKVLAIEKMDVTNAQNATGYKRQIQVSLDSGSGAPRSITLTYSSGANDAANEVLRNASYTALVGALTTVVV
jgi:hypothetical protein